MQGLCPLCTVREGAQQPPNRVPLRLQGLWLWGRRWEGHPKTSSSSSFQG